MGQFCIRRVRDNIVTFPQLVPLVISRIHLIPKNGR